MAGISSTHFERIRGIVGNTSVIIYNNTETYDPITGEKTDSLSSGTTISGIFLKREQVRARIQEGELEEGDAYLLVATGTTIDHNDKVKVNSEYYIVEDTINRYWGEDLVYKWCRLTLYGD